MQSVAAMRGITRTIGRSRSSAITAQRSAAAAAAALRHTPLPLSLCLCLCRPLSLSTAPRMASSSAPLPPATPHRPSATLSAAQRIEHEYASSALRRSQHAARVEELAALEAQLYAHRQAESASLAWLLRLHWSKHGPMIAALLCTVASMSAAYGLWKSAHFHGVDLDKRRVDLASLQAQRGEITRKAELEAEKALALLGEYAASRTAIVTAPSQMHTAAAAGTASASAPAARGWFSWARSAAPVEPAAAAAPSTATAAVSSDAPIARTYRASAADLSQLHSLRSTVEAAYESRS